MSEKTGLHLYTSGTPSGHKASIALAELGVPFKVHQVDLSKGEQHSPEFLRLSPAGRIPVLVDGDAGLTLPESGAILCYLAEQHDPQHKLLPIYPPSRAEALSMVFFQGAHLAPPAFTYIVHRMFGVAQSEEAVKTATKEIRSAFSLLDGRLTSSGEWLAAGRFTLADISCISLVLFCSRLMGMDMSAEYPGLGAWLNRMLARPAVIKGLNCPDRCPFLDTGSAGTERSIAHL